jgi:ATP-dependent DNA helicase RecG
MNNEEFLTKIGLIVNGRLTNAAMVLLGNPDYDNRLAVPIRTMWRLYGADGLVKDYFEFRIPYITVVDRVYEKVRNLTYRYIPNRHSLNTYELPKYDVAMQRELLFNSIAHMDYTQGGRIYVDEYDDYFVVQNPGSFLPGDILTVLQPLYSAPYYRNSLLAQTMTSFNMIDTVAMGIRKVFQIQQKRLFPMPDYLFMKPDKVAVKVYGDILDENYMRILYDYPELDVETVYLLDCVQKRQKLTTDQYKILRKLRVIEGKAPNIFVSSMIAEIIDERGQYIRNKAMDEKYYMDLIISYLQQWGKGERSDFVKLIGDKLPDTLNEKQKTSKVKNILTAMRSKGIIEYSNENKRTGVWVLAKKTKDTTG